MGSSRKWKGATTLLVLMIQGVSAFPKRTATMLDLDPITSRREKRSTVVSIESLGDDDFHLGQGLTERMKRATLEILQPLSVTLEDPFVQTRRRTRRDISVEDTITKIVSSIVQGKNGTSVSNVSISSNLRDELGADTLLIEEIVIKIEAIFNCDIPDETLEPFKTVADLVDYVNKHAECKATDDSLQSI